MLENLNTWQEIFGVIGWGVAGLLFSRLQRKTKALKNYKILDDAQRIVWYTTGWKAGSENVRSSVRQIIKESAKSNQPQTERKGAYVPHQA